MGRVEQNKRKKREALMGSAYELFTTQGFSSTSISEIAQQAGVAKGTFYLYFKNKNAIRDAVIRKTASIMLQDALSSMDEHMKDSTDKMDVADMFIYTIDFLVESVAKDPKLVLFLSKHLSWGLFRETERVAHPAYSADDELDFEEFIKSILEKYNARINDLGLLIFTLLEMVSSTCHDVILYNRPLPLQEYKPYLNNCIRLLVNNAIIQ